MCLQARIFNTRDLSSADSLRRPYPTPLSVPRECVPTLTSTKMAQRALRRQEIIAPQVTSRWMSSALLRARLLLDSNTLLYGLGDWTLAQFEARNLTDNPFYQPNETF